MTDPVLVRFWSVESLSARAMPKSATFTPPSRVMSTLPGLTSRCTTRLRWAKPRAAAMSAVISAAVGMQPALVAQHLGERVALDVLHHDEVGAVGLAPVEHAHDVRVLQVGRRLRTAEALDEASSVARAGKRTLTATGRSSSWSRQVHLCHAAATEPPVELVPTVEDDLVLLRHAIPRLRDGGIWPRVGRRRCHPPSRSPSCCPS